MMLRQNVTAFSAAVHEKIREQQCHMSALEYFVNDFWPERVRWVLGQQCSEAAVDNVPVRTSRFDSIATFHEQLPSPEFPIPSLWLFGRAWLLKREANDSPEGPSGFRVVTCEGNLTLTGEYVLVRNVAANWETQIRSYVDSTTAQVLAMEQAVPTQELLTAQSELRNSGYVCRGNFVFIDRDTPLIGCWLDKHYNQTLGRQCDRDVCVAARLTMPPRRPDKLDVLELRSGRWSKCSLKKGLCTERGPSWVELATVGLSLAEFLFETANHYKKSRFFHENDVRS
jgi:hypothetical protein